MKFKPGKSLQGVRIIQSGKVYRVTLAGVTYKGTKQQIQKLIFDFNEGIQVTKPQFEEIRNAVEKGLDEKGCLEIPDIPQLPK